MKRCVGTIYTLYGRRAGAELYVEKIIAGLSSLTNSGTRIKVFCNKEAFEVLPPEVERIHVPQLDNQYRKTVWLELESGAALKHEGIDLFWIPSGTNNFPGRWNIPVVVTFHDFGEYFVRNKYDFVRTIYRKLICIPRSLQRATEVTVVSKSTGQDLKKLFDVDFPVHTIYSGPSPWASGVITGDIGDTLLKETGRALENYIFVPGRTDYYGKGIDLLLRVYARLSRENLARLPSLIFAGPAGERHEQLIRDISQLGLEGNVIWLGRVSDACMSSLYSGSLFVLLASRYEGFGFPVLEAMQFSVPLLCSDAGSLPEVAGDAGLIFESGSEDSLHGAMIKLFTDEKLRNSLVEKGKVRLQKFDWNLTYEKMNEIFIRLVDVPK